MSGRGASRRLKNEAPGYVPSHYCPNVAAGEIVNGVRCEDLEKLSFGDESFDLHVTQDVFEHLFDPAAAFREIARTLRPGGAHVFTTPFVRKNEPTQFCASLAPDGTIVHLMEPRISPQSNIVRGIAGHGKLGLRYCRLYLQGMRIVRQPRFYR